MKPFPEPEITNRFPSCVALDMQFEVDDPPATPSSIGPIASLINKAALSKPHTKIAMSLTIQFSGEQEFHVPGNKVLKVPGGKATFGIRRCELLCNLYGYRLPLEDVALKDTFTVSMPVEQQREQSSESQVGLSLGGSMGDKPGGTAASTVGYKQSGKASEKMTVEVFQIHKSGDVDAPKWVFETKTGHPILKGTLPKTKLGTLRSPENGLTLGAFVRADIVVRPGDIQITWGQVAWTEDITRNKSALIELAIAKSIIKSQLNGESSLSSVVWEGAHA